MCFSPTTRRQAKKVSLTLLLACGCMAAAPSASTAQSKSAAAIAVMTKAERYVEGQKLFVHDWKKNGPINKSGDGLGPMFNAVSCAACHNQGGVGGGGAAAENVDLLSVRFRLSSRPRSQKGRLDRLTMRAAMRVHSGFAGGRTSLVLHKFGPKNVKDKRKDYPRFRRRLLNIKPAKTVARRSPQRRNGLGINTRKPVTRPSRRRRIGGVNILLTQRNAPALFGAGVIDSLPDSVFIDAAAMQRKKYPGISGRVPQTPNGAVGRFGWRGQTASLHEFVLAACAHELGLNVKDNAQPVNPLTIDPRNPARGGVAIFSVNTSDFGPLIHLIQQARKNGERPAASTVQGSLDLTESQCQSITAYVASLPAPRPVRGLVLEESIAVSRGEKLFRKVGCAACHMPELGAAKGIYSDLLLHDMGPGLSDPVSAVPEMTNRTSVTTPSMSLGYSGGESLPQIARITTNIRQEWRTPPLWGVAVSAPYLHDGRAATLEKAILWHSGESAKSAGLYRRLKRIERRQLIAFLNSLTGGDGSKVVNGKFVISTSGEVDFTSLIDLIQKGTTSGG